MAPGTTTTCTARGLHFFKLPPTSSPAFSLSSFSYHLFSCISILSPFLSQVTLELLNPFRELHISHYTLILKTTL
jgi:hypothetical protein